MNSKSFMTLGEVQDLLLQLRRIKQFYNRQIANISSSIHEHEKIENKIRNDQCFNSTDEDDYIETDTQRNIKRQKINQKIKIKVKKRV